MEVGSGDGALDDQVVPSCVESFRLGTCRRYLDIALLLHKKPELLPCLFLFPLEVRPLKAGYIWLCGPIRILGDRLWVWRVESEYDNNADGWYDCEMRPFAQGCLWREE
jgi:hypothetical protein